MRSHEILREYNEAKILNDFGKKLIDQYYKEFPQTEEYHKELEKQGESLIKKLIGYIVSKDPSPNKELVFWLVNNYANGRIGRWEDISSRAVPALQKFKALLRKPNLNPPLQIRDVNQIKGLEPLEDILDQYDKKDAISNSEAASLEERALYSSGDAVLLHNDDQIKVVIPHTKEAAQFFGKNTRWCTAGIDRNMFEYYDKNGPLYIIIPKGTQEKYQLHWESHQFMDAKDRSINVGDLGEKYPILNEVLGPVALKHGSLAFNPNATKAQMITAIKKDPTNIQLIAHPDKELQLLAIFGNYYMLQYITNQDPEAQMLAITRACDSKLGRMGRSRIGAMLKNPSPKVQLFMLEKYPPYIMSITPNAQTTEIKALLSDEKFLKKLVAEDPRAIKGMKNPSEGLQMAAMRSAPDVFQYFKNPSEKVKLSAVKQRPYNLEYIPNATPEMKRIAVSKMPASIQFIHDPDEELQLLAIIGLKGNPRIKHPAPEVTKLYNDEIAKRKK